MRLFNNRKLPVSYYQSNIDLNKLQLDCSILFCEQMCVFCVYICLYLFWIVYHLYLVIYFMYFYFYFIYICNIFIKFSIGDIFFIYDKLVYFTIYYFVFIKLKYYKMSCKYKLHCNFQLLQKKCITYINKYNICNTYK